MKPTYTYTAQVLRVLDGDTIEAVIQLWEGLALTAQMRLNGINTPETHSSDPLEKAAGEAAKTALAQKLGAQVVVKVLKKEKYGRWLAEVFVPGEASSVNEWMVKEGHAKPYFGGKRELETELPGW